MTPVEIDLKTLVRVVAGRPSAGDLSRPVTSVVIDSRMATPGSLFVAFAGERTDGHRYLAQCAQNGAVAALVEKDVNAPPGLVAIRVDNTLGALQKLAAYRRLQLPGLTVVGVTGSTGKTTTKELAAAMLSRAHPVFKSAGNQNNEIGLPLSIFAIEPDVRYAVLEMGMCAPGEIADLCRISRPGLGIITNVGCSHLEKLGSEEAILAAKFELADNIHLPGIMIVPGDDQRVRQRASASRGPNKFVFFGLGPNNDVWAESISGDHQGSNFTVCWQQGRQQVNLALPGRHNVLNALAAFALGLQLAMPGHLIAEGLAGVTGEAGRLQQMEAKGIIVLDDTYNANPDSTRAALEVLTAVPTQGRRIAFLGDMLELGPIAVEEHIAVGRLAARLKLDLLVAVGQYRSQVREGALAGGLEEQRILQFPTSREAACALNRLRPGDAVLFKGSRGVAMDILVDILIDGGNIS